jgi:hypothetical protein
MRAIPEEEYINGIFVAVYIKENISVLIAGLEIMSAITRRGIHKWDFHCSVH